MYRLFLYWQCFGLIVEKLQSVDENYSAHILNFDPTFINKLETLHPTNILQSRVKAI